MRLDAGGELALAVHPPPHPGLEIAATPDIRDGSGVVVALSADEALRLAVMLEAAAEGVRAGDDINGVFDDGGG